MLLAAAFMRNGSLVPFIAHFSCRQQLNPTIRKTTWHNTPQRRVLVGLDQRRAFAQAGLLGQKPLSLLRPRLEYEIEGCLGRPPEAAEAGVPGNVTQPCLPGLGAQRRADFLGQ